MQLCVNVDNILNYTLKQAEREGGKNSHNLKIWKICETGRFRFKLLINYVLYSELIYVTLRRRIEGKPIWTVVKVTETITIY